MKAVWPSALSRFHLSATAQAMARSWGTKAKPLGVGVFEPTCLTWIKDADCDLISSKPS